MQNIKSPFFDLAIREARLASKRGEVPVGAVIVEVPTGRVLAKTGNLIEITKDPTAHAEILAIREATNILGTPRLKNCDLYVTLEPCPMCAAAISLARIRRLYFGAFDPKGGGVDHGPKIYEHPTCHHTPEVYGGIEETRCRRLLKEFFLDKR
jgi:tRNA(adenine34) deaminase